MNLASPVSEESVRPGKQLEIRDVVEICKWKVLYAMCTLLTLRTFRNTLHITYFHVMRKDKCLAVSSRKHTL